MFPNLSKELNSSSNVISINSIRTNLQLDQETVSNNFENYVPDAIDFIRRCNTEDEAEEIIIYLEKKGEISKEYATKLTKQLKTEGVRSFGSKKEENYYLKKKY